VKIILPKTNVDLAPYRRAWLPFFFLAGPIKGGGDWQHRMCLELERRVGDFVAAIPCRYTSGHPLFAHQVEGDGPAFDRQLTWERHYLALASIRGCIIFWLPEESKAHPRDDGLPYAMDTRGELGEWRWRMKSSVQVVIGAEPDFPGLAVIQRNFNLALGYTDENYPIYGDLGTLADKAIEACAFAD
jgi:hypothetical protein